MSNIKELIRRFESGQQAGPVFAETANDLAESLGGTRCITAHATDQTTAMFYLVALTAVKIADAELGGGK
ncbi:hypothetical protein K0P33_05395 [Pseudomonas sp. ArH3a]|uniref:hypothetical protein n=1 Tax=Pseudomonas sp. ArH3a TaxID=2862945 RepID=UPI001F5A90AF|nr:hypothetical protein [Pseudomonas sp. ArH3a]UNM20893.1 hypothetical protein K0P33_05395 [Pseudomonas sp. ArH3a]